MQIETARLRLSMASDDEMRLLAESETDAEMKVAYLEMLDGCLANADRRQWNAVWFIRLTTGEWVGDYSFKGLGQDGMVEIGYGIRPEHWGNGYANEAVSAAARWALKQPGVTRVEAETAPGNRVSQRVLEKAGFIPTGGYGTEGPRFVYSGTKHQTENIEQHFYTNIDINSVVTPFLAEAAEDVKAGKADAVSVLYPFVDVYAGTQITDVLFDIFCQFSNTDSTVWSDYGYKYGQTVENGISVDYRDRFEGIYTFNKGFGTDPYSVWFDRCRQRGLHPWISIRMNDCHCPDETACFLRSDFFYEARAKGYMVGDDYGYYRYCFDYAKAEVRKRMLAYISEQLTRYDVDGIELDFSREYICFDYVNNRDAINIMNGFMREAKRLVENAEARHGHKIRIGVRLMRDPVQCRAYGLDAEAWVKEKLVDMICVCPRWASCDSDMPIGLWKSAFPDTEIAAGVTDLILRSSANVGCSPAAIAAYSVRYLADSADAMYLYNFFINPYHAENESEKKKAVMNLRCGRLDTALSLPLRHIVTYQDVAPEPFTRWRPLPCTLDGEPTVLTVNLGIIPENRRFAVILGFHEGNPAMTGITLNAQPLTVFSPVEHGSVEPELPPYADKDTTLYRMEIEKPASAQLTFSFRRKNPDDTVCISYLEIECF